MSEKGTVRQMYKQIGPGGATFTFSGAVITGAAVSGEGWEYIPQEIPENPVLVNRQYIDLAGYTQQDLTLFIQAVDFQKDKFPSAVAASAAQPLSIFEYDLITTRRISSSELTEIGLSPPGFLPSTLDLMECIYGEQVSLLQNTNIPGAFVPTFTDIFGSGNPTAADRLHWTRIYISYPGAIPQAADITMNVQACNLVVGGLTVEEKDLVYIERLRRAYTQDRS